MALSPRGDRATALLAAALAFVCVTGASAATLESLYEVTVAAGGSENAAFRNAMADVLIRVTGQRRAPELPSVVPLLDGAARYVSSYRRASEGRLTVIFSGEAIERAVATAGLPFWGEQRPAVLVWLAVDRGSGQRGMVSAEAASGERRAVEAAAEQRGLPLLWPSAGAGEDLPARFAQAWSGDHAALTAAASRYGADAVLIGRAVAGAGGRYAVDWSLTGEGGTAAARGELPDGVHLAADRFAVRYASAAAARRQDIDVTVTGLTTAMLYADATRYLESLDVVRGVSLRQVLPDAAVFRLSVRGDAESLRRELAAGGRLSQVDGGSGPPAFRYQP
jgi:hypothetical protein